MISYTHPVFITTACILLLDALGFALNIHRTSSFIACFFLNLVFLLILSVMAPLSPGYLTASTVLALSLMCLGGILGLASLVYYKIRDKHILTHAAQKLFFSPDADDTEERLRQSYALFEYFRTAVWNAALIFVIGFFLMIITYSFSTIAKLLTQPVECSTSYADFILEALIVGLNSLWISILIKFSTKVVMVGISNCTFGYQSKNMDCK